MLAFKERYAQSYSTAQTAHVLSHCTVWLYCTSRTTSSCKTSSSLSLLFSGHGRKRSEGQKDGRPLSTAQIRMAISLPLAILCVCWDAGLLFTGNKGGALASTTARSEQGGERLFRPQGAEETKLKVLGECEMSSKAATCGTTAKFCNKEAKPSNFSKQLGACSEWEKTWHASLTHFSCESQKLFKTCIDWICFTEKILINRTHNNLQSFLDSAVYEQGIRGDQKMKIHKYF